MNSIFITGAAAGIGRACALHFANAGWFVGLFDLDQSALEKLSSEIQESDGSCCWAVMNVTNEENVKSALETFSQHTQGKMTALLNNAGVLEFGEFHQLTGAQHQRILDVNIGGVITMTRLAIPLLQKSENAHIINLSSASSLHGHPLLSSYAASKAAVRSLTEGLSAAWQGKGISVCDVSPMYVQTDMVTNSPQFNSNLSSNKKSVNLTAEDVAKVVFKAAHGNRIHWYVGYDTHAFALLLRLLPPRVARWFLCKVIAYK